MSLRRKSNALQFSLFSRLNSLSERFSSKGSGPSLFSLFRRRRRWLVLPRNGRCVTTLNICCEVDCRKIEPKCLTMPVVFVFFIFHDCSVCSRLSFLGFFCLNLIIY